MREREGDRGGVLRNYYEVLGIAVTATPEEIKAKYRKLARWYHPDNYTDLDAAIRELAEQRMREINEAYTALSDPIRRARYNRANGLDRGTVVVGETRPFQSWDEAHIEGIFASPEEMKRYTGFAYGPTGSEPQRATMQRASRITFSRLPAWRRAGKRTGGLFAALAQWAAAALLFIIGVGVIALAVALLGIAMEHSFFGSALFVVGIMLAAGLLLIGAAFSSVSRR
jgi:hypothetical protein